ncbi:MAG: HYR domain-containing protein [Bacteroidia bacterium]
MLGSGHLHRERHRQLLRHHGGEPASGSVLRQRRDDRDGDGDRPQRQHRLLHVHRDWSSTTRPPRDLPANITTSNDPGQCSAVVSYTVNGTDNCSATTTAGPRQRQRVRHRHDDGTATATDPSGNTASCSFTVTVNDNEAPAITCPASFTAGTDPGLCGAAVSFNAQAGDNCGAVSTSFSPASGSLLPVGTTTVTATATDGSGNTATCSFTVTVNDNEAPAITCPSNITTSNDPGQCSAAVSYTVSGTDNCGATTTVSPASGSVFASGTTTVTATATDPSGNTATCSFTVTVNDTEAPVATCPASITASNDPGQCSAVVSYTVSGTDNCVATTTVSPASGSGVRHRHDDRDGDRGRPWAATRPPAASP